MSNDTKTIKITISSTGHAYPAPVETTKRKRIDGLAAGGEALVRIKDELGTLSPYEPFVCIAAIYFDSFDKERDRVQYYLARSGNDEAAKQAETEARDTLEAKPESEIVDAVFAAKCGASTALVKAEPVDAEIVKEDRYDWIAKARKKAEEEESEGEPFELSAEPPPAEVRAKLVEEIEAAEKAAAAARTKMKKAAAQIADLVDAGLSEAVALATYRESKAEWFAASTDLVGAQDRLRSFDAKLKQDGAA